MNPLNYDLQRAIDFDDYLEERACKCTANAERPKCERIERSTRVLRSFYGRRYVGHLQPGHQDGHRALRIAL